MMTFIAGCLFLIVVLVFTIAVMLTALHLGQARLNRQVEAKARAEREAVALSFDQHWETAARTIAEVPRS